MIYVISALVFLVIIAGILAYMFGKMSTKYKKKYEAECVKLACLHTEYEKLAKAYEIKKKNKEKADEKISNLHSGDSVANAINILRK